MFTTQWNIFLFSPVKKNKNKPWQPGTSPMLKCNSKNDLFCIPTSQCKYPYRLPGGLWRRFVNYCSVVYTSYCTDRTTSISSTDTSSIKPCIHWKKMQGVVWMVVVSRKWSPVLSKQRGSHPSNTRKITAITVCSTNYFNSLQHPPLDIRYHSRSTTLTTSKCSWPGRQTKAQACVEIFENE